jgi:large repetitive protein
MKNCLLHATGWVGKGLVAAALVTLAMRAEAVSGVGLTQNNSSVSIDPYSQAGVNQWLVDGTSTLNKQWFWWRTGATAEQSLDAISAPVITQANPYSAKLVYTMPGQFDVEVVYTLTGGLIGSGVSDLTEQIQIRNLTAAPLDFHFFQYSDFDLGPSDSVGLSQNLSGKFFRSTQTFGAAELQETIVVPGASHGEVAAVPFTIDRLNDALPTTLNDSASATGDVSWAFQWDFQIAGNGSVQIGKDKRLFVTVPEPTAAVLGGVGLMVLLISARRQRS